MPLDSKDFNEAELFALKDRQCGYRYCPRCKLTLETKSLDNTERMVCPDSDCGFVYYQNPVPAAGALIVENDSILLVKRAHPPRIDWWCIPAGFMEWKEHPEQTAVRELYEETGLRVELTGFFQVYSGDDDPRTNALLILYLARIVGGEMIPGDDASEVEFFSFDDMPKRIAFEAHRQAFIDYNARYRNKM